MPSVSVGSTSYNVTVGYSPSLKAVQQAQGIQGPPGPAGDSFWEQSNSGIYTTGNVAIGTTVVGSGSTVLWVEGDARITGILSVGQGTVTIDGNTNTVNVDNLIINSSLTGPGGVGYATTGYVDAAVSGVSTFSGDYNDLTNKPTNLSSFSNDVGFVTSSIVVGYATEGYVNNLVAISTFSGDYNDLINQPSIPSIVGLASEGYVDAAVSGVSTFSGDYNDLTNKPTIPSDTGDLTNSVGFVTSSVVVGYATEGYVDNLVAISTFSGDYNDLTNTPTALSSFSNDVGFVTSSVVVGYATEGYVTQQISNLVDGAPEALDTLNELAAALNDDENFATTVTNSLALKAPINNANLTGVTTTVTLNVGVGGTIITTTGIGSVGIGSTQPASTLVVNAPSGYSGSVLDTKIENVSLFSVQGQTFSYNTTNTGSKTKFHFGSFGSNSGWVGINYVTHTGPVAYLTSLSNTTGVVGVNNTGYLAWLSTTHFTTNYNNWDLRLYRDDTGVLAQRNSTNPNTFRVYNTYTSATDFERANVGWTTDTFIVGTEKGSAGGTARQLELQTDGTTRVAITTDGNVGIGSTQPTATLDVVGDVRVGVDTSQGLILTSPNGTKFRLSVDDSGNLTTTPV